MNPVQLDRVVGTMIAQAAGDALGSQYESGPTLPDEVTPRFGVGVFGHGVGEWTDDTSMAIPILQILAQGRTLEDEAALDEIVVTWRDWSRDAKDVGAQTRGILSRLASPTARDAAALAARTHEASGRSAGNGSLMRTAPVALGYLHRSPAELAAAAGRVAQLTHWEQDNVDACALWCLAIRHAIDTGELDIYAALDMYDPAARARWLPLIDEALAVASHPRDFAAENGWVVRAFQGALSAVAHARSLPDALFRAVRGGNDTDTVAAIAGALAGAVFGASEVPSEWKGMLHGWPGIDADELARLAMRAVGA
ncbi:ADP-ribosylglycohydrolase family protein [Microbacterium protaetiae]|uniref:ADP-ribosylglycohydrolase family protein n=1 Tax=Microbacterium protaetiae TaxID=2509458 RepID=A0A4V0YD54_9MICO|nr:ADP-ribosylglycohydrolase family protein [Microbacterium protaetiae]QAY59521.1 ADP-ribosylglycohydrolase family protein [Microbacterium protaetiae]